MRILVRATVVCLALYTILAVVFFDTIPGTRVIQLGGGGIGPFDLILLACLVLLTAEFLGRRVAVSNTRTRLIVILVVAYVIYQLLVVVTVAVLSDTYSLTGAVYATRERLGILLVLFFALVVPRHWSDRAVTAVIEWAAVGLFAVALYASSLEPASRPKPPPGVSGSCGAAVLWCSGGWQSRDCSASVLDTGRCARPLGSGWHSAHQPPLGLHSPSTRGACVPGGAQASYRT